MRKILYNGSELFVNKMGKLWTVDIFPVINGDGSPILRSDPTPEPTYHAAYETEAEALADAASWKEAEG